MFLLDEQLELVDGLLVVPAGLWPCFLLNPSSCEGEELHIVHLVLLEKGILYLVNVQVYEVEVERENLLLVAADDLAALLQYILVLDLICGGEVGTGDIHGRRYHPDLAAVGEPDLYTPCLVTAHVLLYNTCFQCSHYIILLILIPYYI